MKGTLGSDCTMEGLTCEGSSLGLDPQRLLALRLTFIVSAMHILEKLRSPPKGVGGGHVKVSVLKEAPGGGDRHCPINRYESYCGTSLRQKRNRFCLLGA